MSAFHHQFFAGTTGTTVLALHGTGGTETDLVPLSQSLFAGANVLAPLGNVSEAGAARFFRRLAEGVFDLENLRDETTKLAGLVAEASQKYGFDSTKVWALGFSNGANIAASLLLQNSPTLAGAVLLRAMTPFVPEVTPDLSGKAIFLAAGRFDPLVPTENIEGLAQILRQAGADTTLHWENASHGLANGDIVAARQFVDQKVV